MKTREWERIERRASVAACEKWLGTLPPTDTWSRNDACACPLHDFIESETGRSLTINSPELSEHWGERETQTWPTPKWMTWLMRSMDHAGSGRIGLPELKTIFQIGVKRNWSDPLMKPEDLAQANR